MMSCALAAGFLANPVISVPVEVDEVRDVRFGNALLKPKTSTLRCVPWATGGRHRVGEFLCEMSWLPSYRDGAPQAACPRYVARCQLRRLEEFGLRLYSAFEAELTILRRSDHKPIFGGPVHSEVCTSQLLAEFECFLYDTEKLLLDGGVDVSKLHTEYGPGQLEFVPQPQFGIDAADTMFRLREGIKEICLEKGWLATFMAQVSALAYWRHVVLMQRASCMYICMRRICNAVVNDVVPMRRICEDLALTGACYTASFTLVADCIGGCVVCLHSTTGLDTFYRSFAVAVASAAYALPSGYIVTWPRDGFLRISLRAAV